MLLQLNHLPNNNLHRPSPTQKTLSQPSPSTTHRHSNISSLAVEKILLLCIPCLIMLSEP